MNVETMYVNSTSQMNSLIDNMTISKTCMIEQDITFFSLDLSLWILYKAEGPGRNYNLTVTGPLDLDYT